MATERVAMSKRLRFEVLKRDGFRCRYCGANAMTTPLEIDHVIAVANGGTNHADNLVTACWGCNAGKSSVPIDDSQLAQTIPTALMKEHAKQIRAMLIAARSVRLAKQAVYEEIDAAWAAAFSYPMARGLLSKLPSLVDRYPLDWIFHAYPVFTQSRR